jgi:putative PEP-CTERM system TPR-repeat lipoprotein
LGYYLKGLIQLSQGNTKEAMRYFELSLQVQENYIPSIILLAQIEEDQGKPGALTQRLTAALKKDDKNTEILEQLARTSERKGDHHQAIEYWNRLNSINPEYVQPYLSLTSNYLQISETRKAVTIATQGKNTLPKELRIINALGIAQLYDHQIDEAIETFARLKGLQPSIIGHRLHLAQAQIAAGKTITARETLNKALKSQPNNLPTMKMLAKLELDDGHPDRARDIIVQISEYYPDDPEGIFLIGKTYLSIQEYDKAIDSFLKGYQAYKTKNYLIELFNTYKLNNNPIAAIELLRDWLDRNPDDLHARALLSDSLLSNGNDDAALSQYQKVIKDRPESAATHNNIAWLLLKRGDKNALHHAEKAVRLKPDSIAFNDTLGWALIRFGQIGRGLHILQETIKKAPQLSEVRYHLAVAYQIDGQNDHAIAELERALLDGNFEGEQQARKLLERLTGERETSPTP